MINHEVSNPPLRADTQVRLYRFYGRLDRRLVKERERLLRFAWMNKYGNVSPQDEILLQLLADAVEARLSRSAEGHEVEAGDQPEGFN